MVDEAPTGCLVEASDTEQPCRVAIVIVAYNAVTTLGKVLDRIPSEIWRRVEEVIVFDDSSHDDTYLVALGYREHFKRVKLSVFRNAHNLGYGGNQKRAYRYVIDKGYDVAVLLHGDGQYAPEVLPRLLDPLDRGEADAVFGSRMLEPGSARKGGMPLYKYVGNKILSRFENVALGTNMSEFHSGYRLYSTRALEHIPFEKNSDDFHFDTQIIIQLQAAGLRIKELPIPTYYGDEICYVNGLKYAKDVVGSVLDFKLHELGLRSNPTYAVRTPYKFKKGTYSSHARIVELCGAEPRSVLDLGCGTGELGRVLMGRGHRVVGVDSVEPEGELDDFYLAELEHELPIPPECRFDIIILGDVLEHLAEPETLLAQAHQRLADGGFVIASLPNVVHWSVRALGLLGRFEYSNRGLLDRGHLRFFTLRSAEAMLTSSGFAIEEHLTTPVPWENVVPAAAGEKVVAGMQQVDYALSRLAPNLFAYQHIFKLRKR